MNESSKINGLEFDIKKYITKIENKYKKMNQNC